MSALPPKADIQQAVAWGQNKIARAIFGDGIVIH